ncbi:MAG TPA: hypothetical protein VFJ58_29725 [Armatimonadota bacterium]|nr:hypothetical protein [Armatimonadota bacterium]
MPDPGRIVTQTGPYEWRSIRYRAHEMAHSQYREEIWTYDPGSNTVTISNILRRFH